MMASYTPVTETEHIIILAEDQVPHPTLRLHLTSPEKFKEDCEESMNQIVDTIKKALDKNMEGMRSFLHSQVPTDPKLLEEFKKRLVIIQELVNAQSSFNGELLEKIGRYLLDSWKMMQKDPTPEKMKQFRDEKRRELSEEFEKKSQANQKAMKIQLSSGQHGERDIDSSKHSQMEDVKNMTQLSCGQHGDGDLESSKQSQMKDGKKPMQLLTGKHGEGDLESINQSQMENGRNTMQLSNGQHLEDNISSSKQSKMDDRKNKGGQMEDGSNNSKGN